MSCISIDDAAYKLAPRILDDPEAYSPTEVNLARALMALAPIQEQGLPETVRLLVESILAHRELYNDTEVTLARTVRGLRSMLTDAETEQSATLDRLVAAQGELATLRAAEQTEAASRQAIPYDPPTFAAGLGVVTAQLTAVAARIAAQVPGATPDPDDLAILANCGDALSRAAAEVSRG